MSKALLTPNHWKDRTKEQKISTVRQKEERGGDQANIIRGSVVAELGNRKAAENQGAFV